MVEQPTGVDQSWSSLSPASAKARGIRVVWDYLSHDSAKDWTAPQLKAYLAAGIGCGFLFETSATRALSGFAGGLADGQYAANELQALIRAVGFTPPNKLAIIAAVDFDTTATNRPIVAQYMAGFKQGLAGAFLTGVYGEAELLDYLGAAVDVGFQTYAWSGGKLSARAALYQYLNGQTIDGAVVDYDRIINAAALGVWWPAGLQPAGSGTLEGETETVEAVDVFNYIVKVPQLGATAQDTFGNLVATNRAMAGAMQQQVAAVAAQVAALSGTLTTNQAAVLGAIATVQDPTPITDAQITALAESLKTELGDDLIKALAAQLSK